MMIVFVSRWNRVSGETAATEMPLLSHNTPMTPNPDPVFASSTTETNPIVSSAEGKSSNTDPALTSPITAETNPSTSSAFGSNLINGETRANEMPLLPHNAPITPNPESHIREPGSGFIQESVFHVNLIDGESSTIEMPLFNHNGFM